MKLNKQLLRLVSQVRYRELTHLIGRKIVIPSFAAIAPKVISAVTAEILGGGALELFSDNMRGVLAKYKMLDLTFATTAQVLTAGDRLNRKMLSSLGFVSAKGESEFIEEVAEDEDPTCLNELIETSQTGHEWVKVFLDMWPHRDALAEYMVSIQNVREAGAESPTAAGFDELMRHVEDLFPSEFRIRDACITNSDLVWLHKHFYM